MVFVGLVVPWAIVYWRAYGLANFLWFCDLGNFLIALALLTKSSLILSSQAVSVLLVQILWAVDVSGRALFGAHPIGGTEYMFDPSTPLPLRLLSLFHVVVPGFLVWGMLRLGYDRRGWLLQTAIAWGVLPICFWVTDPARNINWVYGPLGQPQIRVEPAVYLVALMIAYPALVYLPSHLVLRRLFRDPSEIRAATPSGDD
jgi:hypothetical protein